MMRDELKAFIEENLLITSDGPISDEDELLLDGMIDSLGVTRLIAFIESELHIAVPVQDATIDLVANRSRRCALRLWPTHRASGSRPKNWSNSQLSQPYRRSPRQLRNSALR